MTGKLSRPLGTAGPGRGVETGMKRLIVGFLVGFVVALSGVAFEASPAGACSCAVSGDAEAFGRADAVFTGAVVRYAPPAQPGASTDPALWTFEVREVFKGKVTRTQAVVSEVSGASCGLEIPKRGEFLVFASARSEGPSPEPAEGQLYAGLCGGTRALGDDVLDPALANPRAPVPGGLPHADADEATSDARWLWIGGAVVVLVVGGLALVARRRRAHHD